MIHMIVLEDGSSTGPGTSRAKFASSNRPFKIRIQVCTIYARARRGKACGVLAQHYAHVSESKADLDMLLLALLFSSWAASSFMVGSIPILITSRLVKRYPRLRAVFPSLVKQPGNRVFGNRPPSTEFAVSSLFLAEGTGQFTNLQYVQRLLLCYNC